jgi:hypothetical protein
LPKGEREWRRARQSVDVSPVLHAVILRCLPHFAIPRALLGLFLINARIGGAARTALVLALFLQGVVAISR